MSGEVTVREHSDGTLEKMLLDSNGVWHLALLTREGYLIEAAIRTYDTEHTREA